MSWDQNEDWNCHPQAVVTVDGTANCDIHPLTKVCATVTAVMFAIETASDHHVKQSIQVRM